MPPKAKLQQAKEEKDDKPREPEFPEIVSVAVLARFSGLTERRIQQLVEEGVLPKPEKRGEYEFEPCLRALFAYLREMADGLPSRRAADLARTAAAEADTKERERDLLFKRAIPAQLVGIAWNAIGQELRSGIMGAKIPQKVKIDLIKRLRVLKPADYFKLGKTAGQDEEGEE